MTTTTEPSLPAAVSGRRLKVATGVEGARFGDPALVIHPVVSRRRGEAGRDAPGRDPGARLAELVGLAAAIRLDIRDTLILPLRKPSPSHLLGKGQVERVASLVRLHDAELVVIDGALTPVQQKSLETAFGAKVIDRTHLILEIFGERAATAEGRLQVELAHLEYQAGRLVRSWTHLERQRGGFGFLGGPGETQIETDRRLLRDRIAKIRRSLEEVRRTRGLHRARRQKAPVPVIALVGYTNAGKSTLFNRLTGAEVLAADMLFATLDPTMRRIDLPGGIGAILSDTVGFVSNLPTELVAAFRATLEEVSEADLILHVRDMSHPDSDAQAADVEQVLEGLGVFDRGVPILEVLNKADLLDPVDRPDLEGCEGRLFLSALTGEGIDRLRAELAHRLSDRGRVDVIRLHAADGARRAWLHAHAEVLSEQPEEGMIALEVRMTETARARFSRV